MAEYAAMIGRQLPDGFERHELQVADRLRSYLLYRPPTSSPAPLPLVLVFHGSGIDARQMAAFCGMHELAEREQFAVAYPNGSGGVGAIRTWNAGNCCGFALKHAIDDVGFAAAVLDDVAARLPIDTRRVYATGMSNGGMLVYRLAAELSDRIAAIAPVGGSMELDDYQPSRPVSVCHFHGSDDEFVPLAGGVGPKSLAKRPFTPVAEAVTTAARAIGCDGEPRFERLPTLVDDGTSITCTRYSNGRERCEAMLYTIVGGGHTWPGRATPFSTLGKSTKNLDANTVMWQFFQEHAR